MDQLIKLKFKKETISPQMANEVVNAFIDACCKIDPSIFEPYMDEEDVFEDLSKWDFMRELRDRLWSHSSETVQKLYVRLGSCKGCQCDAETHEFYDDKGKFYFAYLIEKEGEMVKDIYECRYSTAIKNNYDESRI